MARARKLKYAGTKTCPRCGEACLLAEKRCPSCRLIFERLNNLSLAAGRRAILKRQKDKIVRVKDWPSDASKKKALLLCGFLGIFGAHNFYLGRFIKASIVLFGTLCAIALCFIPGGTNVYKILYSVATLPGATVLIFWVTDFISIFMERYKIPCAIPDENDEIIIKNKKLKKLYKHNKNLIKIDEKIENNNENIEILDKKTENNVKEIKNKENNKQKKRKK